MVEESLMKSTLRFQSSPHLDNKICRDAAKSEENTPAIFEEPGPWERVPQMFGSAKEDVPLRAESAQPGHVLVGRCDGHGARPPESTRPVGTPSVRNHLRAGEHVNGIVSRFADTALTRGTEKHSLKSRAFTQGGATVHRVIGKIGMLAAGLVLMVAPAAYASMGLGDFGGGVNGVNFQVSMVNSKAFWLNSASRPVL